MAQGAMFGDIDRFEDKAFFDNHRDGKIFYEGSEHGIEFFAFLDAADGYNGEIYKYNIADEEAKERYTEYLLSSSKYRRKTEIKGDDRIVLLSTCSHNMTNGRYILAGKICEKIKRRRRLKRIKKWN